jgi:hypothetical protein
MMGCISGLNRPFTASKLLLVVSRLVGQAPWISAAAGAGMRVGEVPASGEVLPAKHR